MNTLLIKSGNVYAPKPLGKKDVLIIGEKIAAINSEISEDDVFKVFRQVKIIDASDHYVIPGFIDQHVHIHGAGGEGGPQYRTPPIQLSTLIKSGITSVVGLLGTDGITRSLRELLMKARSLEAEGISAWIYTGSYQVPSPTITGSVLTDIMLIDKVIGVKISLSDHRSSHPTVEEIRRIASDARVAGILSGKAGVVHIHMGSEKPGLRPILEAIEDTDIPIEQFAPTHINRCRELFEEAIEFGKMGGYVDITAGVRSLKPSEAIKEMLSRGVPLDRITMSSDGNGSMPKFNERKELVKVSIAPVDSILKEFRDLVIREKVKMEDAIRIVSTNVARHLKLRSKGELSEGKDADILIVTKDSLGLRYVIARGEVMMEDGKVVRYGTFEHV